jgi:hypothetical protein
VLSTGASVPANIFFAAAIGAGSYTGATGFQASNMVASSNFYLTVPVISPISQTAFQGAGTVINFGCQPTVQSITVNQFSAGQFMLMRAPDQ